MFPDPSDAAVPRLPAPRALPMLEGGRLHEIHAATDDWAAALAFTLTTLAQADRRPLLLVRAARQAALPLQPYGPGLAMLGIDPARLLLVEAGDGVALLRAALEGARCPGLAAVVIASWRRFPDYALTASRRLVLAAERSRVAVVVLRGDAAPRPSAAHQRWLVRSAPSQPLEANAPGLPALDIELQRRRGGPAGAHWRLEWNEEHGGYRDTRGAAGAPLSGTVVSLAAVRAGLAGHSAGSRAA